MQPKLYNWVRAIRNISLISAIYSSLVMAASLIIFLAYYSLDRNSPYPYSLLVGLLATILATISVRRFSVQKLVKKFNSDFSFELLLASWCILLVLLHLECQLLFLMLFQASISPAITAIIIIFGAMVIFFTWPKMESIKSLLASANIRKD